MKLNKNYKKIENLIVFDDGTIYREFKKFCRLVKGTRHHKGYLSIKCHGKTMKKHRVIMEAFYGKSDLTVDHIDGNKDNNSLKNLEYVSNAENMRRSFNTGLHKNGIKQMTEKQKKKVLWNGKIYDSQQELSLSLGLSKGACTMAIKRGSKLRGFIPIQLTKESAQAFLDLAKEQGKVTEND